MKIRICGIEIVKWQNLSLNLLYDSVKSTFSFDLYWDPYDADMRKVMMPGAYNQCTIVADNGQLLLTGVMHSPSFKDGPVASLVNISGYSITGVLDDSEYSAMCDAIGSGMQTNNTNFLQLCQNVCNIFGFGLVDNTGGKAVAIALSSSEPANKDQSITGYLSDIAKDANITLSHDVNGNLVLKIATNTKPVFDFVSGMPGVEYELSFDGQEMHSFIIAHAQDGTGAGATVKNVYVAPQGSFNYKNAAINTGNILNAPLGQLQVINEYSTGFRPHSVTQRDTDATKLQDVANEALADELKNIPLTIKIARWELNNRIPMPGDIITVQSAYLYLFSKARFFVQNIFFSGDEKESTAILNCLLPECFNGEVPTQSIFFGTNYTNYAAPPELPDSPAPFDSAIQGAPKLSPRFAPADAVPKETQINVPSPGIDRNNHALQKNKKINL